MTPEDFVQRFAKERLNLLQIYTRPHPPNDGTQVSIDIDALNLTAEQKEGMKNIVDGILTDVFFTVLCGLDGSGTIGGVQEVYRVYSEDDVPLVTGNGEIEALAWEYLHGPKRIEA